MASKVLVQKFSSWDEALTEMGLSDVSFTQARKIHDVTLAFHNPDTKYLPQNDMLDLLEKVTVYVTDLPTNTEVTVREAIIAVGGDPSLRSTQYGVRQHLLDTKLLVHVPKSNEGFRRIEYTPAPVETTEPELLN